jgi:8-oxo-dGTP pyrophosphatase MutT (NUDIX family)
MNKYSKYIISKNGQESTFQFFESNKLPPNIPISTPFTFPFIGEKMVLCFDKNNWWNPLGGHMQNGETYQDTIIREANEEAGVYISKPTIKTLGYVKNLNTGVSPLSQYPAVNILPITVSFVTKVKQNWKPLETHARGLFAPDSALDLMNKRSDNHQMLEILKYVIDDYSKQNYQISFTYYPNQIFRNIPITQVFTFCKNLKGEFCVVRDRDENFYSLPGGGCELGEPPETCAQREISEEAQITCKNIRLLGSILVELKKNCLVVSRFQHIRYIADLNEMMDFVPLKNGYETNIRKFLPFSKLQSKVFILQNPTAKNILNHVWSIL